MKCCGVHSSKDFEQALEFIKYANDEGKGQVIPEACCILKDNNKRRAEQLAELLFEPEDKNCISFPTVSNSYMNKVIWIIIVDLFSKSLV